MRHPFRFAVPPTTCLPVVAGIALSLLPSPAGSQVASALLREGDVLDGSGGQIIGALSNTAVNHGDGYAVTLNADGGGATTSYVWGAPADIPGAILFAEGAYAGYVQTSFESFFGISNDAAVSYSPVVTDTLSGVTGLDGVWLDEVPVAVEEQVYPNDTNRYWSFGSRPGVTSGGVPYWVGGVADTQGGATVDRGLFYGTGATPLLFSGDILGGLPVAINNVSFDYRFSAAGTHYVAEVTVDAATSVDTAIGIDGAVALSDGQPIREGTVVPVASGGNGTEAWSSFDFVGITEEGDWMLTGNTNGPISTDEFMAMNGVIVLREGDMVDGQILTGAMEGGYLNEDGDYALIWDIVGETAALEALLVNDHVVLVENDEVDWDGDGLVDPGTRLVDFTGISSLTLGDRINDDPTVDAYFTADVEVPLALAGPGPLAGSLPAMEGEEAGWSLEDVADVDSESSTDRRVVASDLAARGTLVLEAAFRVRVPVEVSAVEELSARSDVGSIRPEPSVLRAGTTAALHYQTPVDGPVSVDLFSTDGRHLCNLFRGDRPAGSHVVEWDGRDGEGRALAAGVYLVRSSHEGGVQSARVVVVD